MTNASYKSAREFYLEHSCSSYSHLKGSVAADQERGVSMTRPGCAYIQADIDDAADQNTGHSSASHLPPAATFDDERCEGPRGYLLLLIVMTITATTFYGALAVCLWKFARRYMQLYLV